MSSPALSIVMPVYNAAPYIREAVESLLVQTYADFELIVVDDGSTDQSISIVEGFRDQRIVILKNECNSGIVFSRNRGTATACGRYIAPFDSDDIARMDKFEKQIAFLEKNPDFGMIGSWAYLIDENSTRLRKKWKVNAPPERIPAILLFRNYFVQSAMVIRREALPAGFYTQDYDVVEDYKMWIDIARNFKVWNYPDYLLEYRVHQKSITQREKEKMEGRDIMIFKYIYRDLEIEPDSDTQSLLTDLKYNRPSQNVLRLKHLEEFLLRVIDQNKKLEVYSQAQLIKAIFNRWGKACFSSGNRTFRSILRFSTSKLNRQYLSALCL